MSGRRATCTRLFAPRLEDLPVEEFHVAVLDAQHRLERDVTVTRGILNSSLVHPREVFREAIAERAAAIILVHNHPSGDPTPSPDDRTVTEQLVAAGRLLDIPVHDHVIIGRGRYASFAEAGLLVSGRRRVTGDERFPHGPRTSPARLASTLRTSSSQAGRGRPSLERLDLDLLVRAYRFSEAAHRGTVAAESGEPFVTHCVEVAKILAELQLDTVTVARGLIHDVVEDTAVTSRTSSASSARRSRRSSTA